MPKARRVPAPSNAAVLDLDIESRIFLIRGRKVMLDLDLARLYGVPTKRLNEQVRRNIDRFPEDFLFRLTETEMEQMRSQIATASPARRNARFRPLAFTEHGVTMLSAVLRSARAIAVSVADPGTPVTGQAENRVRERRIEGNGRRSVTSIAPFDYLDHPAAAA